MHSVGMHLPEQFALVVLNPASPRTELDAAMFAVDSKTGECDLIRKVTDCHLSDCSKFTTALHLLGEGTARRANMPVVFFAPSTRDFEALEDYLEFCRGFEIWSDCPVTLVATRDDTTFIECPAPVVFGDDEDFEWIRNALKKAFCCDD